MSENGKVVSLHGQEIAAISGEPHPGVIEMLELILERARSGDIQGIRIAVCHSGGTTSGAAVGYGCYAQLGMMYSLTQDMAAELTAADQSF